jgi:hypothetical protein
MQPTRGGRLANECSIAKCTRRVRARGFCHLHWQRWSRTGDPNIVRPNAFKHHGYNTREYEAWEHIIQRCTNPRDKQWSHYGGRGITICDEWRNDFSVFLAHIGPRPTSRHSIDRYPNNDGNYEPGNVRWATPAEQRRNTRSSFIIEYNGRKQCLLDWSHELGINRETLRYRLRKMGLSMDDAIKFKSETRR